jgi:hypothetical protein
LEESNCGKGDKNIWWHIAYEISAVNSCVLLKVNMATLVRVFSGVQHRKTGAVRYGFSRFVYILTVAEVG